ncbi:hypothetical protein JQ617_23740 [Bradyrhizobium sp. KB893862 SZCCT0404]|uniref:hypothetical protein n=1 Tax=Bradyrhizobium sp. KB893862 SZCCT0404 TaxID=2807672 RepID=UPI001BABA43F|nr:hypothetical protein [Bradyrhizobium sp. KB893862 SZCCT0404]MBR1176984.1 hypothetical protein [Bradyrhizobium sp. KB893862 SZCCT0404]
MSTYLTGVADAMMALLDELLPPDGTAARLFDRTMVASYVAAKLAGPPQDTRGCATLKGPKTPKMSERPLKTLQDFSPSELNTVVHQR